MINKIYNISCFNLFEKMKHNKEYVDLILTDPPYNISKENNFTTIGRSGIDFGLWDYGFDQSTWIKEVAPLVKKNGSIIIFNDWKNMGEIASTLEECGFEVKDLIRWIKTNPMPRNTERRYVTDFEWAIWAVKKGAKWTFNIDKNFNKYLRPEFKTSIPAGGTKRIHPTQKSLNLIEDIIKIHSNKGDIVLDPFSGSGTVALASKINERNFIASEIDEKYYKKSVLRLKKYEKIL
ncbi:modification methylase [Spiroplasma gladiatoris]|uniref:Methyltransferase n=1 Tax=Spiroplasma gladiatoris TaxID=2143 RepID=A0A4P7AJ99_9MOLU|nr:site-specific DNA-methyltransferase [Spiroplasma gladiatoris]QBQ07813.1 modification methylase [Spiroplasma gladiatoris]